MQSLASRYIPPGALKVADKLSDAVAYLYQTPKDQPAMRVFYGRQSKPVQAFRFRTAAEREAYVVRAFEARRAFYAAKQEQEAQRRAYRNHYKPGDLLGTCWGYEQTNREFFEVVAVVGQSVVLREVAQERIDTGWCQGKAVPLPGDYVGDAIRRKAQASGVRIDASRWASPVATETVAGIKVATPVGFTTYA